IDAGRGNPGAIALDYVAHNRGCVEDVLLRAPEGSGFCGLNLTRHWPGPALVKRVEIHGFDYGVRVEHYQYGMTFEHLTLRNPRVCGIYNSDNVLAIRGLNSLAKVPVLDVRGGHGTVALTDSTLKAAPGTPSGIAAIQSKGRLYLRDVKIEGYAVALRDEAGGKTITARPDALKFYAWPTHSTKGGEASPLRLPVKETPEFHSTRVADWVNVKDFPADDPADSIQMAIDSGKPIVYLPNGKYDLKKTVILRGNVRKIIGFSAGVTTPEGVPAFRAEKLNGAGVTLEHISMPKCGVVQASDKALALRHADFGSLTSAAGATGDIFLEDTMGHPITVAAGQSLWGRQVNCEFGDAPLIVNNGNLWLLGYKTEGEMVCLDNRKGGRAEVLGALLYPLRLPSRDTPMFRNEGGAFSACYRQNGGSFYRTELLNNGAAFQSPNNGLGLLRTE
ncbi:MAG: glycoside hydrolase family 55 protein, partial [Kiritimatiellaeota bacterium]|nr:glycoside hydrolase family 55 protein [Kiritimatiellota bacterium]